ncbi:hypothetical protein LTR50_002869 [Elasticomyces elasticus]|nr:hypothetical protein LTR50_002869 [Elasticomyces elasticus]
MVNLKSSGSVSAEPKPQYGHLSEIDPEFEPLREATDAQFAQLWQMPMDEFKMAWLTTPPALPPNCPVPGKHIEIVDQKAPVRDGTQIGIRIYRPIKPQSGSALYLKAHGGGWVVGSHEVEEAENRFVAGMGNVVVVSVDYRMAPEYKFPYAINDCFDVLKWCKSNASSLGINPERIVVGGGSAGGNIASVLAQMVRDEKVSGIVGQVLNIPVTCHPKHFPADKYEYGSYQQNKDASVIDAPKMDWFWEQYLPNATAEPYASPLLAKDLSGLAPALVQVAGLDPLRDEGLAYAEALKAAGVSVTVKTYQGLPHGFYMFPQLKASDTYIQTVVDFINSCIGGSSKI